MWEGASLCTLYIYLYVCTYEYVYVYTYFQLACNDVCIEPNLQPITEETFRGATANTQEGARLGISANGVWGGRFEKTYFNVRIFNPHAPTNKGHARHQQTTTNKYNLSYHVFDVYR